ncbi:FAD-binding protein [Longivirga aurantiaca]|uniref:FAD-binding protein n=1 Tax=Longivirga aurantiaca TaxID=1837743 RepID=A0ABW1SZA9_9ACTN
MTTPTYDAPLQNWARNVTFAPERAVRPRSVDELRDVVASTARVRALGTGHSFSPVADTDGTLVLLDSLPRVLEVDAVASTARVSAGTRWGELAPLVDAHGLALHNMGSLPHISVAGSASTGTHGSGSGLGCLATAVRSLDLVTADGSLHTLQRGDADFDGSVVALGALGIVTSMTLDLEPSYDVEQTVWEGLPFGTAVERFDDVMGAAYSVSLFTTWTGHGFEQVWVKRRAGGDPADLGWTGSRPADAPRHPVPGVAADACTEQGGVPGPWFERLPHFRLEFTPSAGAELQTEYMVPRSVAREALEAVQRVAHLVAPVLQISEVRTVAGDDLWLSPCQGRDTVCIHFTWVDDAEAVAPAVLAVERGLAPYDARPHWGKVFTTDPDVVRSLYPRRREFEDLRARLDPGGVFGNAFVDRYLLR